MDFNKIPNYPKPKEQVEHEYLYWERDQSVGIRKGDMKAVIKYESDFQHPSVQIYNLSKDPFEKNDLASIMPQLKDDFINMAKSAHNESELFPLIKKTKKTKSKG